MRKEDNDCIRYLMKEMDPSEELLMERAMMEDEDLLIEVESMRQTLQKLNKLPQKKPPAALTNTILEQAAEQAKQKQEAQNRVHPVYKYAVAATLALTITAGGAWFFMGSEVDDSRISRISSAPSTAHLTFGGTDFSLSSINYQALQVPSKVQKAVAPWVDREDVIHFTGQNNDRNFEALMEQSNQKLKLIDHSKTQSRRVKSIQLTGN